jgi:Secretion system C-terminal sorting domain
MACGICNGQNLVPNPGFEDTVACPTGFSTTTVDFITYALGWSTACNSSDYYNSCSTGMNSVPDNIAGHYPAATGNAYCGMFVAWQGNISTPEYHEMIGAQLVSPLIIGQKYFVSFKTICSAQSNSIWRKACNKLGVLFSTVAYHDSTPVGIHNFSHIYTDSIITDTINWTIVKGLFIADSSYTYILLGNFFDMYHTDTINFAQSVNPGAYYFFDDICVSTDSFICNSSSEGINDLTNEDEFILYPNPFQDKINITGKRKEVVEVTLFDIASRKLFNKSFTNSTIINTEQLAKGIYIYEVRNKYGVIKNGKLVKG